MAELIMDKDLPKIGPADIKIDTSEVDKLDAKALEVVKQTWVCSGRTNEQLIFLINNIPEKIDRVSNSINKYGDKDGSLAKKIVNLKEEYAVCIKEIEVRKAAVK